MVDALTDIKHRPPPSLQVTEMHFPPCVTFILFVILSLVRAHQPDNVTAISEQCLNARQLFPSRKPRSYRIRIVAVGDIHGDIHTMRRILEFSDVIHPKTGKWTGKADILVQTGNMIDRLACPAISQIRLTVCW